MAKVHNFSAGPCILPKEVFEQASQACLEYNNTGLSLLEMSHRSPEFVEIMEEARSLVKEILNVPDGYTVLFLQGGASLGFLISAMNMFREHKTGAYINTGSWSTKAIKECENAGGTAIEVASSKDKNFSYIPKEWNEPDNADFLHYTSNNTIFGTQFKFIPDTQLPLVCDMSSDIFSKNFDVSKYDIIYGGAQKNLGPAGATVYIVKEEILGRSSIKVPTYLDLQTHHKKDSAFNTPPVFSVYCAMLTLRWMKSIGGVEAIEARNREKSDLLYDEIERNPLFKAVAYKEDRSLMNPTFVLTDENLKDDFDKLWKDANISGIKGHRSVGGYRASMYNAMEKESVQVLVDVMKEFANKFATV